MTPQDEILPRVKSWGRKQTNKESTMYKPGLNSNLSTDGFITGACPNLYVYHIIRQWEDRSVGVLAYSEEESRKYVGGIYNSDSPDAIIPTLAGVVGVLFEHETPNESYDG